MNLLDKIKQNKDGVTIKTNGQVYNPKTGYFVATTNNIFDIITNKEIRQVKRQAKEQEKKMRQKAHLGYWKDKDKHYLDVSFYKKSRDKAMSLAKTFDQLAVFDCKAKESVYLV